MKEKSKSIFSNLYTVDIIDMEVRITSDDISVFLAYKNNNLLSQRSFGSHLDFWFDYI